MVKRKTMGSTIFRASALGVLTMCGTLMARADSCNGYSASGNLVSNCGFETGTFSGWTGSATMAGPNYAGVDTSDYPNTMYPTPYEGTYEAYFGGVGSTVTLTQTIATTAGTSYQVEFALLNDTAPSTGYTDSFLATFGSGSYLLSAISAGPYMLYSFGGLATSSTTNLSFTSRNDGGYFELDSISVVTTPEPSSLLLLGSGVVGLGALVRRRRNPAR